MIERSPKGWCPTLYAPMASGDGLLVRVRPPGAVLSAEAARALATWAARCGNGLIELTNRASIQVRGLSAATVAPFAAAMVAAGLADADPGIERRRIVIAPPLAGDDPGVAPEAARVAAAIETARGRADLAGLPAKFGVLVDGGGVLPIASAAADIRVSVAVAQAAGVVVTPDGTAIGIACTATEAATVVTRLACACLALGGRQRMRTLIAVHGAAALFAAANFAPPPPTPLPRGEGEAFGATATAIGWLPYPTTARGAFGVGLPFGACDAATLHALAELAERHGDATLRVTPFRALAIAGVTDPEAVRAAIGALGLIAAPADPRARVVACPGKPSCASASVPARADAARLAALDLAGTVHVSGCAKGCAHPGAADITLVGEAGRYGLVHAGRAGDRPLRAGLTLAEAAAWLREASA